MYNLKYQGVTHCFSALHTSPEKQSEFERLKIQEITKLLFAKKFLKNIVFYQATQTPEPVSQ